VSVLWSLFSTAVNVAIDERNRKARQLRALERIANATEEIAQGGMAPPYEYPPQVTPPPQGKS
jgi:hypothetical protein